MVSGSARSFLTEMVAAEHSPFFQHFSLLEVGPFSEQDAVQLLVSRSVAVNPIPASLAARGVEVIGGHPFYLQLLGESLLSEPPPLNEQSLKTALQDTVFSRTGRLALYFENEFHRRVGHSTGLAAVLEALAQGPKRLAEIAREIGAASGTTAHYLERLQDAVGYREDSKYELADPTFALWLRWRRPGGTVVPMAVVGDEAERRIAEHLSRMGFELVYPSRGSRGAFDLLATRGTHQLAVQVKRSALPLRFDGPEWDRMVADAARFHWRWVLAAVTPESNVLILDPAKSQHGREVRLDAAAAIENLLLWLDQEEH
jgi:Holliday junction resolvase